MKTKQMLVLLLLGVSLGREAQAFYNPSAGRWLNRDPAGEDAGDLNLHVFVRNAAINRVDQLGLMTWQDLEEVRRSVDGAARNIRCCCVSTKQLKLDLTLTGSSAGAGPAATVTGMVKVDMEGCVDSYQLYWWDCYTASAEAGIWHNDNDEWRNYGWSRGGSSYTKNYYPHGLSAWLNLRDPYHLAMESAAIYIVCGPDGRKHALLALSRGVVWTWNKSTESWTAPTAY